MFLVNYFTEKIDDLYLKVQSILDEDFETNPSFNYVFLKSVNLCLIEFSKTEIDKTKGNYIWRIAKNEDTIRIARIIYKEIKPLIKEKKVLVKMNISEDIKIIILIAMGVTGVGLILFLLNQPSSNSEKNPKEPKVKLQSSNTQYLILVIGSAKSNILDSLKINISPDYDLCEKLYQSSKFIWIGSQPQSLSLFDDLFSQSVGIEYGQKSEYDVYFVKIELLNYNENGFDAEVSSINRIDAFRQLENVGKVIAISNRLPASSYQRRNLYER